MEDKKAPIYILPPSGRYGLRLRFADPTTPEKSDWIYQPPSPAPTVQISEEITTLVTAKYRLYYNIEIPVQPISPMVQESIASQYRFISQKMHESLIGGEPQQYKVLNNLIAMNGMQIQMLNSFYNSLYNTPLQNDIQSFIKLESLRQACWLLMVDNVMLIKKRIQQALETEDLTMLVNTIMCIPEQTLIQAIHILEVEARCCIKEVLVRYFRQKTYSQQLIMFHIMYLCGKIPHKTNHNQSTQQLVDGIISELQAKRIDGFLLKIATIPRQKYDEVASHFEAKARQSLFKTIIQVFNQNDADLYTVLIYSEYKIDVGLGIALILNEQIKKSGLEELILTAIVSRYKLVFNKPIQEAFRKYGDLAPLLKDQRVLTILWQVAQQ